MLFHRQVIINYVIAIRWLTDWQSARALTSSLLQTKSARSLPREGYFFCLETKEAKIHSAKRLLCRTGPFRCKAGITTGRVYFALLSLALCPRFSKISNALATHKATIVLPVFARSCFADVELRLTENTEPGEQNHT